MNIVGINLCNPVFTHDQLCVALSHITDSGSLFVLLPAKQEGMTENIVYPEVLLEDPNHSVPIYMP